MKPAVGLSIIVLIVAAGCAEPTTTLESGGDAPAVAAPLSPATSLAITAKATVSSPAIRSTTTTTTGPSTTPYVVPIADPRLAGWSNTHSSYRATDIFVSGGCGGSIVSPVNGTVLEVRTVDQWNASIDNPATRGGRSVAVLGHDGVRYYFAHFGTIEGAITVGAQVTVGQPLGTVGESGRTSACHVHFGISPPCPDKEWSVRRGVVWPYPYLDAWKVGSQLSPADEVQAWLAANPGACAAASADPFAGDA